MATDIAYRILVRLDGGLARVTSTLAGASVAFTILLMGVMLADVVTRTLTGGSLTGSLEVSETLLVAIVFCGIAYAERSGDNVRVRLLGGRIGRHPEAVLRALGTLVAIVVTVWLAWASVLEAVHSLNINEYQLGLVQYPLWPARMIIAVGFMLISLEFLSTFFKNIVRIVRPESATLMDASKEVSRR